MATDPNPALRAEIQAALAVVQPQIRGLHDLLETDISPALKAVITSTVQARENRQNLLLAVIRGLDATLGALQNLDADGYPALPDVLLSVDEATELSGEKTDLEAAIGIFSEGKVALDEAGQEISPQPTPVPTGP